MNRLIDCTVDKALTLCLSGQFDEYEECLNGLTDEELELLIELCDRANPLAALEVQEISQRLASAFD